MVGRLSSQQQGLQPLSVQRYSALKQAAPAQDGQPELSPAPNESQSPKATSGASRRNEARHAERRLRDHLVPTATFFGTKDPADGEPKDTTAAALSKQVQTSPGWEKLDAEAQASLLNTINTPGAAGDNLRRRLHSVVHHNNWPYAGQVRQGRALQAFSEQTAKWPRRIENSAGGSMGKSGLMGGGAMALPSKDEVAAQVESSKGWKLLDPVTQERLERRIEAPTERGNSARGLLSSKMARPEWHLQSPAEEADTLKDAIKEIDSFAALDRKPMTPDEVRNLPAFGRLSAEQQAEFGDEALQRAGYQVTKLVGDPQWSRATQDQQTDALYRRLSPGGSTSPDTAFARLSETAAFEGLQASEQSELQSQLRNDGKTGRNATSINQALESPSWALHGVEGRQQILRDVISTNRRNGHLSDEASPSAGLAKLGLTQTTSTYLPADAVADAERLPGFAKLEPSDQNRLRSLLGGETNPVSRQAREAFAPMSANLDVDSPEGQAAALRDFINDDNRLPLLASELAPKASAQFSAEFGAPEAIQVDFEHAGKQPGLVYPMTIGERTFRLVMPAGGVSDKNPDLVVPSHQEIGAAMSRMSAETIADAPEEIVVSPVPTPGEDSNVSAEAKPDGAMVIYPQPSARMLHTLTEEIEHEIGHFDSFESLGGWKGMKASIAKSAGGDWQQWQTAVANDGLRPSQYSHNVVEDYAEVYSVYMSTRGTSEHDEYRQMFPARFELLDKFVPQ